MVVSCPPTTGPRCRFRRASPLPPQVLRLSGGGPLSCPSGRPLRCRRCFCGAVWADGELDMYRIMPLPNRHFSKRCPTSDVSLPLTLGLIACLLLLAGAVHARLAAIWEPVPVARLFQNVGRYVKQHPN